MSITTITFVFDIGPFGGPELDRVADTDHGFTIVLDYLSLHVDDSLVEKRFPPLLSNLAGKRFDILLSDAFSGHE
jgi:hypothetical protein